MTLDAPKINTTFEDKYGTLNQKDEVYWARRHDVAQEKERNYAEAKQSQDWQSNQLLLSFPPFPVRHPVYLQAQ